MIDLLQAAFKVPEINNSSCYDIFKDFVFPSIITFVTIWAAIELSKKEFSKNKTHEDAKKEVENSAVRTIVLRNIQKIIDQAEVYSERYHNLYLVGYDLKKPFYPLEEQNISPELITVMNIDSIQLENVFITDYADHNRVNKYYNAFGAIHRINIVFNQVKETNLSFVNTFREYDIKVLTAYDDTAQKIQTSLLKFFDDDKNKGDLDAIEIKDIINTLTSIGKNSVTLYSLYEKMEKVKQTTTYSLLIEDNFDVYFSFRRFLLQYSKLEDELELFRKRIAFLILDLKKAKLQLSEFLENYSL